MKYPIGIQSFDRIIEDGYVYVDKTAMIYSLVKEGKIYFLSRPRRFGKSLLVSTLKNYFLGRKELFKGLAIDRLEKDWLEYPVFHLDFNGSNFREEGTLEKVIEGHISAWEKEYDLPSKREWGIGWRFIQLLRQVHERTGRRVVFLVDDYDKPLLEVRDSKLETVVDGNKMQLETRVRNELRGFYSALKAADEHLHFVFLAGLTQDLQKGEYGGFNHPEDISMNHRYEALCGITQEELDTYFADPISCTGEQHDIDAEAVKRVLKRQYGGYHFGDDLVEVYNPCSLLRALDAKSTRDCWFQSDMSTYLLQQLNRTRSNLNELAGRHYNSLDFMYPDVNAPKLLSTLYQWGFLTIKGYNMRRNTFLLDFPNDEVKNGFLAMVASDYLKPRSSVSNWVQDTGTVDDWKVIE
ncbi:MULTISPECIES: ATP-binding protein [Butyricimonas]|uniref:ATP-binding protein n=1 Tax=Butyricimonas TaxID=574697 RepID=UPI0007FB57B3|nr:MULTISPECIES: AAA family ATPase [Butyricimonas]